MRRFCVVLALSLAISWGFVATSDALPRHDGCVAAYPSASKVASDCSFVVSESVAHEFWVLGASHFEVDVVHGRTRSVLAPGTDAFSEDGCFLDTELPVHPLMNCRLAVLPGDRVFVHVRSVGTIVAGDQVCELIPTCWGSR